MTPLDLAWSVLKADPNFQAFSAYGHPDTGGGTGQPSNPLSEGVQDRQYPFQNLGTVDPRVISMAQRPDSYGPEGGRSPSLQATPLEDQGFESISQVADYGGSHRPISRAPRDDSYHLRTHAPRQGSPQHIIDAFMRQGGPLTPEEEAELARRLRMAQQ